MNTDQWVAQLGSAVERRRKSLGLTQAQVCDLAAVGLSFLHQLEHGKRTVRLDKLLAVLVVLGLGLNLGESIDPLAVAEDLRRADG